MERRVSWSDPLIQPSELHEPPDEQRHPREPDEDATPSLTAGSTEVAEAASPETASPERALPVAAGGGREGRFGNEVVSHGPHAESPSLSEPPPLPADVSSSSRSPNVAGYAGSALVMIVFTASLLAFLFVGTVSPQRRRLATGEVRINTDKARYLPPTTTTWNPTLATNDDELMNTTVAPVVLVDTHRAGKIAEAHGYRPKATYRRHGRRHRGRHQIDGHHRSGVKNRIVVDGRHFVPVTPLDTAKEDYQQADV